MIAPLALAVVAVAGPAAAEDAPLFIIGTPDGIAAEFGLARALWPAYARTYRDPIVFTAGESPIEAWPYIHPSTRDAWAGGRVHSFTIRFRLEEPVEERLHLFIGVADAHQIERSQIAISVNGSPAGRRIAPKGPMFAHEDPSAWGRPVSLVFPIPADRFRRGPNEITIALEGGELAHLRLRRALAEPEAPEDRGRDGGASRGGAGRGARDRLRRTTAGTGPSLVRELRDFRPRSAPADLRRGREALPARPADGRGAGPHR